MGFDNETLQTFGEETRSLVMLADQMTHLTSQSGILVIPEETLACVVQHWLDDLHVETYCYTAFSHCLRHLFARSLAQSPSFDDSHRVLGSEVAHWYTQYLSYVRDADVS
eukprot:10158548-Karenia_brevis.AAC.1